MGGGVGEGPFGGKVYVGVLRSVLRLPRVFYPRNFLNYFSRKCRRTSPNSLWLFVPYPVLWS